MLDSSTSPSPPFIPSQSSQDQVQLLDRVKQGDMDALQTYLNQRLLPYQARVEDIGLRKECLQFSISGPEVPHQEQLEPLLQSWIVQLGLLQFSAIELYGQKDGSALPFWRCSFNPKDVDLKSGVAIAPPEVSSSEFVPPVRFVDPLQVEFEKKIDEVLQIEFDEFDKKIIDPMPDPWEERPFEQNENTLGPQVSQTLVSNGMQGENRLDAEPDQSDAIFRPEPLKEVISEEKSKVVKDFLARYAAGERDFAKIQLNEADLSGVNLTLANLHGADLIWANLSEANLYHIDFSRAKLRQANLSGAMLRSSNLQGTDFVNANLRGADLSWSNLNGANLTGADLTDANLKNAILERVILPDGTLLD